MGTGLLEPVGHQVRPAGHPPLVELAQGVGVAVSQFAAHFLVSQERRVADDGIHGGPFGFAAVGSKHGVPLFDVVQGTQDGVAADGVAVGQHPLQFADPHRGPGQFGGVGVELDAQDVGGAGFDADLAVQAEGFGVQVGPVLQVLEGFQGEVEEVAGAAGRVQHPVVLQPLQVADEGGLGGLVGGLRALAALMVLVHLPLDDGPHGLPLGGQRGFHHRADEFEDGGGVGVVGAELAAHVRVQPALEQGAEDGGLHGVPVHAGGLQQGHHVGGFQGGDGDVLEQAAVEPGDGLQGEVAALLHGPEQVGEAGAGFRSIRIGLVQHRLEQLFRQQAGVLGEHAEHALDQEVGHGLGRFAPLGEARGYFAHAGGGFLGDGVGGFGGAELLRVGEQPAEFLQVFRLADVRHQDGVGFGRGAGEVGVDVDDFPVGHHQQGWIVQGQGIGHELLEGGGQVPPRRFVFPGEAAPLPHVRPAVTCAGAGGATLEAVVVRVGGLLHLKQFAQVEEVGLGARPLGEDVAAPLGDEFGGGHGQGCFLVSMLKPAARLRRSPPRRHPP